MNNNLTKDLMVIAVVALLVGCAPKPDMSMKKGSPQLQESVEFMPPRVEVTRIGVFEDDLAYNSRRGIYVIKDRETGKEFIGISGIGISELGSHSEGKTLISDER